MDESEMEIFLQESNYGNPQINFCFADKLSKCYL